MLRTALSPKWLGLLALVIAVMTGFAWLGRWQLDVAQEKGLAEATREAAAQPIAPLTEVIQPGTAFPSDGLDRKVTVTGEYVADQQVLVTGRKLGDRSGYWVVAPLRVEGSHGPGATPAAIPILRGFVGDPAAAPTPPSGRVTVTGTLSQSEPSPDQFRPMPAGQVQTLNIPVLLNRWGGELYNGFVFLADQDPAQPSGGDAALTVVPPPASGVGQLNWRNLGYALQWFFFGAFALYMWWRMVREDAQVRALAGVPADSDVRGAPDPDVPVGPDPDLPPGPDRSGALGASAAPATPATPTTPATVRPQGEPSR